MRPRMPRRSGGNVSKTYIQLKDLPCSPAGTEWKIPEPVNGINFCCYWPCGQTNSFIQTTCYSEVYLKEHPEFWKLKQNKRIPVPGQIVWMLNFGVEKGSYFAHQVSSDDIAVKLFESTNNYWFSKEEAEEAHSQLVQLFDFLQTELYKKSIGEKVGEELPNEK